MSWFADEEIEDIVDRWEIPKAEAGVVINPRSRLPAAPATASSPSPKLRREIIRQTAGSAREGFAWAFRQAALLVLTVLPLMGAQRAHTARAQAEFMERMKAQQAAGGGAPPSGAPRTATAATGPTGTELHPTATAPAVRRTAGIGPEPRPAEPGGHPAPRGP